jgi:N-acetylmuramoyl-L-alanine amidase
MAANGRHSAAMQGRWGMAWVVAIIYLMATPAFSQAWTRLPRTELFGNEYLRLAQWAETYKYDLKTQGDTVVLTSRWSRLVFKADSRQAEIRGVQVHLSVPVAKQGGEFFISSLDAATVLQPLLYPVKAPKVTVRSVCIDPGHGGKDPGNIEGKFQEKRYTLLLAEELQKELKAAGLRATLSRSTDTYHDPAERPGIARRQKADLLVSLHYNSAADASVRGLETYCMTPAKASSTNARGEGANTGAYPANQYDAHNVLLAWHVQQAMVQQLGLPDRGVRRARFAVLRFSAMPAILVEAGFMSNPAEMARIADATHRKKMAQAIAQGILAYKKAIESP